MDFQLSEEQELFRRSVAEFGDKEVVPIAARIDEEGQFPTAFQESGGIGLFWPPLPGGIWQCGREPPDIKTRAACLLSSLDIK
jgi:alkylation response protein AidB-like acyl-CoA dehydrogenase